MTEHAGILSLLPPALAIVLAIATRQVFLSLLAGIWAGKLIVGGWNPLTATANTVDACVSVFADAGNTRVIIFCIMVGALIALVQRSGGVDGFIDALHRRRLGQTRRSAGLLALAVGAFVFVESSISCLVTGAVARPMFDRLRLSREKLAYVCDTASAPVCILIPLNGWGAFVVAQLRSLGVDQPVGLLARAIFVNFYALISLIILILVLILDRDFGPMRRAQRRAADDGKLMADGAMPMISEEVIALKPDDGTPRRALNMIIPVGVMVLMMPLGLYVTGLRNLAADQSPGFWQILDACSGSTAVLWAVLAGVATACVIYRVQGLMRLRKLVDTCFTGAGGLVSLGVLMMLAFAIGAVCRHDLGTGEYVASLIGSQLSTTWAAPLVFVTAAVIAFSTGTSWGTFAIMLPIALPVAQSVGLPAPVAVSAVLGGGVFGDHCSPISDTTIVSSMASASDHIDHVRTQLPYALTAGMIATVLYTIAGAVA